MQCDLSLSYITGLVLISNSLAGDVRVPYKISALSGLRLLQLDGNVLQGTFPFDALAGMMELRIVMLGGNGLTGEIPPGVLIGDGGNGTAGLELLSLEGNAFTGNAPEKVCTSHDGPVGSSGTLVVDCRLNPCSCCKGPFCG